MAHVVGVPRRDPCQKCQLPVFLAERLAVGKKVYHRTCLKCARCSSQLTPGSFYETEVDDEYCCETCPDEEDEIRMQVPGNDDDDRAAVAPNFVQLRQRDDDDHSKKPSLSEAAPVTKPRTVRRSIADRLAFFEQSQSGGAALPATILSDAKLLQKSLSDEEKSQSLKRNEENSSSGFKLDAALTSFLTTTVSTSKDAGELDSETTNSATDTTSKKSGDRTSSISNSDVDGEELSLELNLPELPKTQPPNEDMESSDVELKIIEDDDQQETRIFTARAQVQLINNQPENEEIVLKIEESENESETEKEERGKSSMKQDVKHNPEEVKEATSITQKSELGVNKNSTTDYINNNNNHNNSINHHKAEIIETFDQNSDDVTFKVESILEHNDNNCLTKEEILQTNEKQMGPKDDSEEEKASNVEIESNGSVAKLEIELAKTAAEPFIAAIDENVEMRPKVEAAAIYCSPDPTPDPPVAPPRTEDIETTKRLSVVRARLHQFEVNANDIFVPESDGNSHKNNEVDSKVNTRSSSTIKNNLEGVENVESVGSDLKANPVLIKDTETEKSPIQVPENDNENELMETTKYAANIEEKEREKTPMEIDEEENEKMEAEQEVKMILSEIEKLITATEKADQSLTEEIHQTIAEKSDATIIGNAKGNESKEEEEGAKEEDDKVPKSPVSEEGPVNMSTNTKSKTLNVKDYPHDLNPFQSDDESDKENSEVIMRRPATLTPSASPQSKSTPQKQNLNPFDSSDDEIELEKSAASSAATTPSSSAKVPPPRPPPPRISRNPFGDETAEDRNFSRRSSLTSSTRKTPVPTPRNNLSLSQNPTPEPTPRLNSSNSRVATSANTSAALHNASDYYGSANSLSTPQSIYRNSDIRGSNNSLASSVGGTIRSRKQRRAPAPPAHPTVKELFPSAGNENVSINNSQSSTPGSSTVGTPKQGRKKRPAPAPPKPARLEAALHPNVTVQPQQAQQSLDTQPKNSFSYPLQSELDSKLSDEEKALLEGNHHRLRHGQEDDEKYTIRSGSAVSERKTHRLIPLDASLLLDEDDRKTGSTTTSSLGGKSDDVKHREYEEEFNVVYRRSIIPPNLGTPTHDGESLLGELKDSAELIEHNRQLEKLKDNKEAKNRNRQSQISMTSSGAEDSDPLYNKSSHGKWKRRKGPAPALPIPPRKVLQMLPLQEIKHELEIIEVQQQGLEKQGVVLEKMIRDRCEGVNGELLSVIGAGKGESGDAKGGIIDGSVAALTGVTDNSKEVEDLILQLFELVNEKNELFRRQAELMYLRRQHRLEQDQADIEYEIRVLMAQPERNKTDSDKAREEALIARLVEVVQLRNEVVECLEMDRLREAEEDLSIKKRLELHTAQREGDAGGGVELKKSATKLSKKEKKKQKETKKLVKSKKLDVDKDADETELKTKKKKKKFLF